MVGDEGGVVANEDAAAEGDADRQALIVAVPEPDHVFVAGVGAPDGEDAEVAVAVWRHAMVLLTDLMAVVAEAVHDEIDKPVVRQWDVRGRSWWCLHLPQAGVVSLFRSCV